MDAGARGSSGCPSSSASSHRDPCDGLATILTIARPLGNEVDPLVRWEYVRAQAGTSTRTAGSPPLRREHAPDDAVDAGWTNGNVVLWISPSNLDRGIYLVPADVDERWARAADTRGVVDCN